MIHRHKRTASLWRPFDRLVHTRADRISVSRGNIVHRLCNFIWNRAGDGVQVTKFLQVLRAASPDFEQVVALDIDGTGLEGLGQVSWDSYST
jgi:hypothetical protein